MIFDRSNIKHFVWGKVNFRVDDARETVIGQAGNPAIQIAVSLADSSGNQRKDVVTIFEDNSEDSPFVKLFMAANARTEQDLVGFCGTARAWRKNNFTRMAEFLASQPAPDISGSQNEGGQNG